MRGEARDKAAFLSVLRDSEKLAERIARNDVTQESFSGDTPEELDVHDSVMMTVFAIVEELGAVSDETRAALPGVPWNSVHGFRNVIAHTYAQVDDATAWEAASEEIPDIAKKLRAYAEDRGWITSANEETDSGVSE